MDVQPKVDFFFGEAAFARPSNAQGVNQSEEIVEGRITPGGTGHARIEGLDGGALHLAIWVWPNGSNLFRRAEFARQDGSGPCGWHPAGDFLGTGGIGVRHTVNEKVAKGLAADFPGLGIDQMGVTQPTDGGMDFGGAHA